MISGLLENECHRNKWDSVEYTSQKFEDSGYYV